jgi:hypothetical protein
MKNILITAFLFLFLNSLSAQSVGILCGTNPPSVLDCFAGVEPGIGINYMAEPQGFSQTAKLSYSWIPIGGNGGGTSQTASITWSNTPNNPLKSIKVTAKDTASQSSTFNQTATSPILPVTVKQIGPITTVIASGSNISQTAVGNNGSLVIPCGATTFDLTVNPPPATYPVSQITYTWTFPWGIQTTNSTTVTTTSNVGGSTPITVTAKKVDGTTSTPVFTINVDRPKVGIPSFTSFPTANVCNNATTSVQTTATNVTTYNWTSTGAIDLTYTYNWLYAQIKGKNTGSSGTVTLTVDNGCLSPKSITGTIYVGPPAITSATVNWQPLSYPNYIYNPGFLTINVNNAVGSSTNWTILNGAGNIYYAGQNQVSVYAYPFMRVEGVTSNQCGVGEARTFYVQDISNGYYRMASPNPTTNIISSEILAMNALKKVTLVSDAHPAIVRMYNVNGSLNADTHRNNNLLSFDIGNLPRGRYYLNFSFDGNKNFTEQIDLN